MMELKVFSSIVKTFETKEKVLMVITRVWGTRLTPAHLDLSKQE